MNFNFKNLSENIKRIRIIPKNGTELFANIGVDNPTAMIDEDGVFSVCLSPYEAPEYGDWILNQGFNILDDDIRYTGYKTNGVDTYDSFALSSLQDALVKSFLDSDFQQYVAFTTAVEQLIGAVDWVLDPANNRVKYFVDPDVSDPDHPSNPSIWVVVRDRSVKANTREELAKKYCAQLGYSENSLSGYVSFICSDGNGKELFVEATLVGNPAYEPNVEREEKYLPFPVVAAQVISNAESGEDEVLKLLSEDYINLVANSVFDSNPSKQFVKLEDLIPQLETNKVLR